MGKKQHSKDRMFITKTEWATEWGGAKSKEIHTPFKRLPFYCCALTFTPFEYPVCTADGSVFDLMNITPYLRKYGKHPVTGAPLKQEDLIPLTFHKNSEGEYHCPVLNKVFTEFTHIVAVKTTGNVFCYEAVKELNIKTKNWKELLTDEPFTRDDLITIQNPNALDSRVTLDFDHVKKGLKVDDEELNKLRSDPTYNMNVSGDIKQMLKELGTEKGRETALHGGGGSKAQSERAAAFAAILAARSRIKEDSKSASNGESKPQQGFSIVDAASAAVHGRSGAAAKADSSDKTAARIALHMAGDRAPVNAKMVKSRYTTGAASRSFTSTSFDPVTKNEYEYIKVEKNPKKKGYVQLHTTHGDLNIELHCDMTPRTCENFLTLCQRGYYNGVAFHRSIRNFMIQGGDPTGTGKGGQSIWGKPFKDELNSKLVHSGRGVVSMANSGPHTNGSQFFILYKSANHLNFKHTVFGGVVGGLTTLAAMEKVPVDDDDRPLEEIKINSVTIFVNPYTEPDEEEEQEKAKEEKGADDGENEKVGSWCSNPGTGATESITTGGGVAKYLKARNSHSQPETSAKDTDLSSSAMAKKRKVGVSKAEFKDFSAWLSFMHFISLHPPLTLSQKRALAEESHFQNLKREYRDFSKAVKEDARTASSGLLVGRPWEMIEKVKLKEIARGSKEFNEEKLKMENLRELKETVEDGLKWVLDDDIEIEEGDDWRSSENQRQWDPTRRRCSDKQAIRFLVDKLSCRKVQVKDWKLAKIMKQSGLPFSEGQLMKIVEGLGHKGKWEQAMAVVEWVYNDKERRDYRSRFVYAKLLSVLRKERRPKQALLIFNLMREDCGIYPDMAAYHIIAVVLGQAGMLKELIKIIECMRQKPSKRIYNIYNKNWDPLLEPDMVIYNAILNACIPNKQWKGVSWVFEQLRKSGLKPNGATYGLAMEVMLHSGKYDLVHELFRKMNRRGESPKALTYKVLVRAFWQEGKIDEAVKAVRDMEQRGIVGTASVYYELACCVCNHGRWQDAVLEVNKIKRLSCSKPLEVTFTGMIMSSLDGGHISHCISIFEYMKAHCVPNIGTINIMLKVYCKNDLFSKAKLLFEEIRRADNKISLAPDEFTYSAMLEASASALQWEYFELVYREMVLSGYQLVRSKYASLLVEASRSGKGHLLEHAFEAALEAGEIPHHLLFTEMVFQATAQQNYERAVVFVNTMSYAPFQISERQWLDLFLKNRVKITRESLKTLLDALGNADVSSEPTVLNLSKALHNLCGSIASDIEKDRHRLCSPEDSVADETGIAFAQNSSSDGGGRNDTDGVSASIDREAIARIWAGTESGTANESVDEYEMECGMAINEVDDSELPSADEILCSWKESRNSRIFTN